MILVAKAMRSVPIVLETKGQDRDARRLSSITYGKSKYATKFKMSRK